MITSHEDLTPEQLRAYETWLGENGYQGKDNWCERLEEWLNAEGLL